MAEVILIILISQQMFLFTAPSRPVLQELNGLSFFPSAVAAQQQNNQHTGRHDSDPQRNAHTVNRGIAACITDWIGKWVFL